MKKNIILSVILIGLLSFTYFFQELGSKFRKTEFDIQNRVVNIPVDRIDTIELENVKLIKVKGVWMVGELDFPASQYMVDELIKQIEGVHKLKELPARDEEQYFANNNHQIIFSSMGRQWKFRLGDVSELTGNFYFQEINLNETKTYVVTDTSEYSGFYKSDLELMLNKYLRFRDLVLASADQFFDRNIFKGINLESIEKVTIDNKWNRWFEVNLRDNSTTPKPPSQLLYLKVRDIFLQDQKKLEIKNLIKRNSTILNTPICTFNVIQMDGVKNTFTVFGEARGSNGIFVTSDKDPDWIYELETKARDFLFGNVQKYWDKKLFTPDYYKNLVELNLKIGDKNKLYNFHISDVNEFELNAKDEDVGAINRPNTNLLFHLLFSLTQFEQAYAVYEELPKGINSNLELYVQIFDKKIDVIFTNNKIFLVNKSDKLVLEYLFAAGEYKINSLSDFFTVK